MSADRVPDERFAELMRLAKQNVLHRTEYSEMLAELDRLRHAEIDWATEALVAMSGLGGTPVIGYLEDGGPARFRSHAEELRHLVHAQREALALKDREITELREVLRQHKERGDDA